METHPDRQAAVMLLVIWACMAIGTAVAMVFPNL